MAGSRRYWWERYTDKINPRKWVRGIVKRSTPQPERRRGSREFGQREQRPVPSPILDRGGASRSPYREVWNDEGGDGSFSRDLSFFQSLPIKYDTRDEEMTAWEYFVRYMTKDSGYRYGDPGNPFWSQIGRNPRDFDWAGWRAAVWGGRHRS
jgi:hypothetical protein